MDDLPAVCVVCQKILLSDDDEETGEPEAIRMCGDCNFLFLEEPIMTDTESDGFDNLDSVYGETESNVSYGGFRLFNGESDEVSFSAYGGDSEDYVDVRGFEEFLENLAETDGSRRYGAPPAAVSFVNGLPRVAITGDHEKHGGGLVCAICKESLSVGTEANQLPCCHLYHPPCIRPWLAERNSCPLCRYELPTDDKDYEEGKMMMNSTAPEIARGDFSDDDDSSDEGIIVNSPSAGPEGGRRRWFFLAAAAPPIVGLVGMAIAIWFQNPVTERRGWGIDHSTLHRQTRIHGSGLND